MTWKDLLKQSRVQLHTTSKAELGDLRALVARDLKDAALPGLSADRKFAKADAVSETEADELLQRAEDFEQQVEAWIAKHYPALKP
jgi:hypothetical protein